MKKLLFVSVFNLLLSLPFFSVYAQNLVPNPSFEDTIACPIFANQLNNSANWWVSRGTPDYFHECDFIAGNTSVPYNFAGFQYPASGKAYVGLFTFSRVLSNERELITCQLTSPLIVGQTYIASMKVSRSGAIATIASDKIGMLFTTQTISSGSLYPVNNFSQIFSNVIISDSLNWSVISGSFTADSSYQYLNLGNFYDDNNTDTIRYYPLTSYAYYYIDDVSVIPDSVNGVQSINKTDSLHVFPNPAKDHLNITVGRNKVYSLELCDINTKLVKQVSNLESGNFILDINDLCSGIYYLKIITTHQLATLKVIKL